MEGAIHPATTRRVNKVEPSPLGSEPPDRELHVILDNACTHKESDDWLTRHPDVQFYFTPNSASWVNQVKISFGLALEFLTKLRASLRRQGFSRDGGEFGSGRHRFRMLGFSGSQGMSESAAIARATGRGSWARSLRVNFFGVNR